MAMGRIELTLLDGEFSGRPNRPKTIACNATIPQKVTNVSIHDKGPEPSRLESSDPMREAGAPNTVKLLLRFRYRCARPTGGSHGRITDGPAQRREDAKQRPRCVTGRVQQRGQQHTHYKGRDTPKDNPARLPTLRVATTTRHPNVLDFLLAVRQLEHVPEEVPAVVAQASLWLAL